MPDDFDALETIRLLRLGGDITGAAAVETLLREVRQLRETRGFCTWLASRWSRA